MQLINLITDEGGFGLTSMDSYNSKAISSTARPSILENVRTLGMNKHLFCSTISQPFFFS